MLKVEYGFDRNALISLVVLSIQLFRERLLEEVHATIRRGIVGGFEFTVLKKKIGRIALATMDVCLRALKESSKTRFDSYSVRNSVLIISHITFRDCRVHIFPTTFFKIAVYYEILR